MAHNKVMKLTWFLARLRRARLQAAYHRRSLVEMAIEKDEKTALAVLRLY